MRETVKMVSQGLKKDGKTKTGTFRVRTKNKRTTTDKLEFKYYDPRAWNPETQRYGMHVVFKEGKIK